MLSDLGRAGHLVSYSTLVAVGPTFVERVRNRDEWFCTRCADPTAAEAWVATQKGGCFAEYSAPSRVCSDAWIVESRPWVWLLFLFVDDVSIFHYCTFPGQFSSSCHLSLSFCHLEQLSVLSATFLVGISLQRWQRDRLIDQSIDRLTGDTYQNTNIRL